MPKAQVFWAESARVDLFTIIVIDQLRLFYDYLPEVQRVEVVAVIHSRRDVAELLRTRLGRS